MLKKYLLTMELSGFKEIYLKVGSKIEDRLWRKVKNRSFHALHKDTTNSSNEVLLIHKKES